MLRCFSVQGAREIFRRGRFALAGGRPQGTSRGLRGTRSTIDGRLLDLQE